MNKFLDPNLECLQQTLYNKFEIPVYQRPYKWEKEQIKELFEDILLEFQLEGRFFLGTVFLSHKGNLSSNLVVYEIVDGQQRVTTLALMLLVLYASFYESGLDEADPDVKAIKGCLWKEKDLKNDRDCRLITSGSLEKMVLDNIFNWCFDNPRGFISKIRDEKKENTGIFEKPFYENIILINDYLHEYVIENDKGRFLGKNQIDKQKLFYRYLRDNVNLITITLTNGVNEDRKKLFEIFESINAKGRKLDEIDLIKSYIFQNIDTDDYDQYLGKWGELIQKTNDKLEDYLAVFIKAKIKYYKNSINVKVFKSLSENALKKYYNADTLVETLEAFIDDMARSVDQYRKLEETDNYILKDSDEFKFYTATLRYLNYSHPKPLLFRAYCDYADPTNMEIQKKELIALTKNTFVFMMLFQTLQQKDSKETATKFESIMNTIYENSQGYFSLVNNKFEKELTLAALNQATVKELLKKHIGYEAKAKNETRVLLAAYEFGKNKKFKYEKMLYVLKETKNIQVDHIAVRHPESDNDKYSYYCAKDSEGNDVLCLKQGSDYINNPNVNEGMDYELFIGNVLNKTGNLQLMWSTDNKIKNNGIVELPEYINFYSNSKIYERSDDIAETLINNGFLKIEA